MSHLFERLLPLRQRPDDLLFNALPPQREQQTLWQAARVLRKLFESRAKGPLHLEVVRRKYRRVSRAFLLLEASFDPGVRVAPLPSGLAEQQHRWVQRLVSEL